MKIPDQVRNDYWEIRRSEPANNGRLIAFKQISCIDLLHHIVKGRVIAVGDDGVGAALEGGEVVHDLGAEEGGAVGEGRFVDDNRSAFGLDALHDALDGGLAEVVGAGLHGKTEDPDGDFAFAGSAPGVLAAVAVIACLLQHAVRDVVLARPVRIHTRLDQILGHIIEIRQQLLGILRQAVPAITKTRIVVVRADAGIQTYAIDDVARVQALELGVGIQFVEVADAQGEVGVGEELHGLRLFHAHIEHGDVLLEGALLQEAGKRAGALLQVVGHHLPDGFVLLFEARHHLREAHDNAGGVEVVVERLALAQEFRAEKQVKFPAALGRVLHIEPTGVADGDRGFDDHRGIGVDAQHQVDDLLDVGGIEEVLDRVVVGRRGDDDELRVPVGCGAVEGGGEAEGLLGEVFLDVFVLDGADAAVEHVYLLRDDVHGGDVVVLGQQGGDAQAHVAGAGNCNFHNRFFALLRMTGDSGSSPE